MSSATESAIEPAIVLAAYAEPVASGRRVLFVGPAVSALPASLLERIEASHTGFLSPPRGRRPRSRANDDARLFSCVERAMVKERTVDD